MSKPNDIQQSIEQLAVAQAVYKIAAEQVSTKEPGNLRERVAEHYRELYEQTGAKSFDVSIGGQKVGSYGVRTSKAKSTRGFVSVDEDAYRDWCERNGYVKTIIDIDAVFAHFRETGEVPDGCEVVTGETPEGEYLGGTLRVSPEKVNAALGGQSPMALLMGGAE